jgi:hypothetical protein
MSGERPSERARPAAGDGDGVERRSELELDEVDVKDLLRRALGPLPRGKAPAPDILRGVQRRIRDESKGRFFADGWSTTPAPRATFLVTSLVILLVSVALWLALSPLNVQIVP